MDDFEITGAYLCIMDFIMCDGALGYRRGKVYYSHGYFDMISEVGRYHRMREVIEAGGYMGGEKYFEYVLFKRPLRF
jgi:hypothetical protein